MIPDHYDLAGSDVSLPLLGVGTWAWGDRGTWGMGGYDGDLTRDTIQEAWDTSIDAGVNFFDTAEVYGRGESERIIGAMLARDPDRASSVVVATKFMPSPWKVDVRGALLRSLRASLERLGLPSVDLYQIHGPISLRSHAALADALADAHQAGLVKAVGVSNYSAKETRAMAEALRGRGMGLATNQIEFSLLRRAPGDQRAPQGLCRRGRGAPGLLAHRAGSTHRQVLGIQSSPRQADVLQPPDGSGRRGGCPTAGHR